MDENELSVGAQGAVSGGASLPFTAVEQLDERCSHDTGYVLAPVRCKVDFGSVTDRNIEDRVDLGEL